MAGVQVDPGSRVEEVRKCMNQLHTISGLHAIPVTSVVSPSHTHNGQGKCQHKGIITWESAPIKLAYN